MSDQPTTHRRWRTVAALLTLATIGSVTCHAQGYAYWLSGNAQDVETSHRSGLLLAGGGGDNDAAMAWLLEHADGGDVVVLRASGSDGYNDYLFSQLGVVVNSVETIRFDGPQAASDPFVLDVIAGAEVLFLAGGNQTDYVDYWLNTPVGDAIAFLQNDKRIAIGGTSAGMAVLGQVYYAPVGPGVTSDEALGDPFHPFIDDVTIDAPLFTSRWLTRTVTDTHYDQRNRRGRHMVFMARAAQATGKRVYGIAANEYTAVAISPDGHAQVFGDYPSYDDYAYFLQSRCAGEHLPETLSPGTPLNWYRDGRALTVYRLPGTPTASGWLSLVNWRSGSGGDWQHWTVNNGVFSALPGSPPPRCSRPDAQPNPATLFDDSASGQQDGAGRTSPGLNPASGAGPVHSIGRQTTSP